MSGQLPRCNPRQRRTGDIRWQSGIHQDAWPARDERRGKAARGGTVSGEGASGGDAGGGGVTGDEAAWRDLVARYDMPAGEHAGAVPWPDRENITELPPAERPAAERPPAQRPPAERPAAERPAAERPAAERP